MNNRTGIIEKMRVLFPVLIILLASSIYQQEFIRGVDISTIPQIELFGGKYKLNGQVKDPIEIFKSNGANYVRLRLWHSPSNGYCGLEQTLQFAKRIKASGLKFLLNLHYSDTWADPGRQTKPSAWSNLTFDQLKDSVYTYTKRALTLLNNQQTMPDMVQIGNEISGGMLWPDGKLYNVPDFEGQKIKFTSLLKEGIRAVKEFSSHQIKTMIHIPILNGNVNNVTYFYDIIRSNNVEYDIIGLSYYPWWHGNLTQLRNTLNTVANRYSKEIIIVETAYPWTTGYQNDGTTNLVGPGTTLIPDYPATPQGQKDFLLKLSEIIKGTNNTKGTGFFYWEPALISLPGKRGSDWENVATFGFSNSSGEAEALESLSAFGDLSNLIPEKENNYSLPDQFLLHQNFPNPFNPETIISYQIPKSSNVSLKVYNLLGQEIAALVEEFQIAGKYSISFNIHEAIGYKQITSGIYFYRLTAGNFTSTKKLSLIK